MADELGVVTLKYLSSYTGERLAGGLFLFLSTPRSESASRLGQSATREQLERVLLLKRFDRDERAKVEGEVGDPQANNSQL